MGYKRFMWKDWMKEFEYMDIVSKKKSWFSSINSDLILYKTFESLIQYKIIFNFISSFQI